jgi:hypothetical protein
MEAEDPRLVKIGELLISVGVLTTGDLTEAIQISRRMGVPIGRVLVMSGCVNEHSLQQTLELQSLIKDGMVDRELGEHALKIVFTEKIDLQESLQRLNWQPRKEQTSNKLGDLLIDSTIVTPVQLERALEASFQSGMPLGGTLVLQGVLSAQLLPTVLHVQERIREGVMPREDAVEELKRALMFWARAEQSKHDELQTASSAKPMPETKAPPKVVPGQKASPIFEGRPPKADAGAGKDPSKPENGNTVMIQTDNVSLVELLKLTGFCTQNSLEKAIQEALSDSRLASKLLLSIGFIESNELNDYIQVQALIARGKLRTDQALYVVNSMRHRKLTLEQALTEMGVAAAV